MRTRREVLGDAHVDASIERTTDFTADFQDLITRYAWGEIWTRPGLDRRMRSAITLTALVAGGHENELAMHVRAARRNGLSAGRDQGDPAPDRDLLRRAGRKLRLRHRTTRDRRRSQIVWCIVPPCRPTRGESCDGVGWWRWGSRPRSWPEAAATTRKRAAEGRGADEQTTLTVGVIPIADVAPLYLGIKEGFFEEENLKIEPQLAEGGAAITPAVLSGDFQIGFSNTVSLLIAAPRTCR